MGVQVETGSVWRASTPAIVLNGQYYRAPGRTYDVSVDGKRFLMIKPDPSDVITALTGAREGDLGRQAEEGLIVVQNWHEELKRVVPTN